MSISTFSGTMSVRYTDEVLSAAEELLVDSPDADMVQLVTTGCFHYIYAHIHFLISIFYLFSISGRIFQL